MIFGNLKKKQCYGTIRLQRVCLVTFIISLKMYGQVKLTLLDFNIWFLLNLVNVIRKKIIN